ncbi:hypothetical protein SUDANB108_03020 [Streptomyces sp. enrichment culture]
MSLAPSPPSFPLPSWSASLPPGPEVPAAREVPRFAPVRVGGGRIGRLFRNRRRALAVGLVVTATALVAAAPRGADGARGHPRAQPPAHGAPVAGELPARARRAEGVVVTAPVRIADAATVRLLRPGDRVDVIAAEETVSGGDARVVARGARVTQVPEPGEGASDSGALVVLSVPRGTAARLAGASATARLAVTLW